MTKYKFPFRTSYGLYHWQRVIRSIERELLLPMRSCPLNAPGHKHSLVVNILANPSGITRSLEADLRGWGRFIRLAGILVADNEFEQLSRRSP